VGREAEVYKEVRFEAAHRLPKLPAGHKCHRLHGHSFRARLGVRGPLDPELGWVVDFADIKRAVEPALDRLDHSYLNEIEGLENPTAENIAIWLWERVKPHLPGLFEIVIHETCTGHCVYRG
jgi:6-pyruvoyltetrahydropterin/6-carboxytetrahydropterin synthase